MNNDENTIDLIVRKDKIEGKKRLQGDNSHDLAVSSLYSAIENSKRSCRPTGLSRIVAKLFGTYDEEAIDRENLLRGVKNTVYGALVRYNSAVTIAAYFKGKQSLNEFAFGLSIMTTQISDCETDLELLEIAEKIDSKYVQAEKEAFAAITNYSNDFPQAAQRLYITLKYSPESVGTYWAIGVVSYSKRDFDVKFNVIAFDKMTRHS